MTVRTAALDALGATALTVSVLITSLLSAAPVLAATNPDDGQETGPGLSVLETLLLFVGLPAAMYLAVVLLVSVSARSRGPRYRPGVGWWSAPVWFNGPDDMDDTDAAVAAAGTVAGTPGPPSGGGASARW